jgi:hypothetical protein
MRLVPIEYQPEFRKSALILALRNWLPRRTNYWHCQVLNWRTVPERPPFVRRRDTRLAIASMGMAIDPRIIPIFR